jgi:hypothetical protein
MNKGSAGVQPQNNKMTHEASSLKFSRRNLPAVFFLFTNLKTKQNERNNN